MILVVLDTGLFPDRQGMAEAVNSLEPHYNLYRRDVRNGIANEEAWDQILDEILDADRVVVV